MNDKSSSAGKPVEMIAAAVRREREKAGLSLSALASAAGVGKSTLSQLEAGNANPSVETLWALATALNIPFSFLFEATSAETKLIRAGEGEALSSEASDYVATLLAACAPSTRRDLYRLDMQPGAPRVSDPHPRGTMEHAVVCSGRARVGPTGVSEELGPGDYYTYPGDVPHAYEATAPDTVVLLVMESS